MHTIEYYAVPEINGIELWIAREREMPKLISLVKKEVANQYMLQEAICIF